MKMQDFKLFRFVYIGAEPFFSGMTITNSKSKIWNYSHFNDYSNRMFKLIRFCVKFWSCAFIWHINPQVYCTHQYLKKCQKHSILMNAIAKLRIILNIVLQIKQKLIHNMMLWHTQNIDKWINYKFWCFSIVISSFPNTLHEKSSNFCNDSIGMEKICTR